MTVPIVTWCEVDENDNFIELGEDYTWSLGQVKAGLRSEEKSFYVWNNKGGTEDVSPMQDCQITVVDNQSEHLDIIEEQWIKCRLDTIDNDDFDPIGGSGPDDGKEIRARGADEGVIGGTANDGEIGDEGNFAKVTMYVQPNTETRQSGIRRFKVRVSYFYV